MTTIKGICSYALVAVLTAAGLVLANRFLVGQPDSGGRTISREGVISKVQSLSRLQTVVYNVDTVISSEKQGNWYVLWQDGQKGLFIAHGRVQAGVDLHALTPGQVQVDGDGKNIVITLPAAQIFETYLGHIEVYDLQTGLLGRMDANRKMFHEVQSLGRQQVRAKACQADILKMAAENARKQVQTLFELAAINVTVHVQAAKACG